MLCYKVVTNWKDYTQSYFMRGSAGVKYAIGYWSYPPEYLEEAGYGLCVFGTAQDVLNFIHSISNDIAFVYLAECEDQLPERPWLDPIVVERGIIPDFPGGANWPSGTLFFRKVKLVKLITPEQLEELANDH